MVTFLRQMAPGTPPVISMHTNDDELRHTIVRLNSITMGVVLGTFAGLTLFLATIWLVVKGGREIGPHLSLLGQYFPGYSVTFLGSIIGFLYGLVLGFVVGFVFGRIYNYIVDSYAK